MDPERLALDLASRQGGVITTEQAHECGLNRHAVRYRLRIGRWTRVSRSVYRLIEMNEPSQRLRAAIAALPNSVVSHESAAEMHGIPRVRRGIAVVSVHSRTTHAFPGVMVRRNHDLLPHHTEICGDLPCTTLPRTVVDLAALLHPKHVGRIVDDLVAEKRIGTQQLSDILDDVARRGKPGSTTIRTILANRGTGPDRNATVLERRGLAVLLEGGLPAPLLELAIPWNPTRRFDACYPEWRIAIEWDSRRWHQSDEAFEQDRERDRSALLHGWCVYRFTWRDVTQRPEHVVETIRTAIERARLAE
ncbi:MAG: type IV toxin-antitoxin system AbiEi family antitoxin domain-containing protein [Actinomycetota bacterium]